MANVRVELNFTDEQLAHIRDAFELDCQEWRNKAYSAGQKHDPIGKQEIINQIIAGRWDA